MTIPARNPFSDIRNRPELAYPDVSGLSLLDAALAYAEAGWYVLPTDPADAKNPGGVVHGKWQEKSSRDPRQIRRWWTANPDYGIALHCGRSGAGVFDFDGHSLDEIAAYGRSDIAEALTTAEAIQGTRAEGDRSHYIFLLPDDGKTYGNSAGAFMQFGEFRGKNGVIIAAPTPHPDAETKNGEYRQVKVGPVGPMPDVLRACLSEAGESVDPLTDAQLEAFIDAHTGDGCGRDQCAHSVDGPITRYHAVVDTGASRYETLVSTAPWALSEAMAGCYSARDILEALHEAYMSRFGPEDGDRLNKTADEFLRVMKWAAAQADPARSHRNDDTLTADDLEQFWLARPELTQLRQFARARCVGPWSMFGAVLAKAVAAIPPHVVLPGTVGSEASLNIFVALVAHSGGGKNTSEAAADDFLDMADVFVTTPGSGEGILKQYAYVEKRKGQEPRQVNLRNAVVLSVGEVDSLTALTGRTGSTLMPELRKAWMGERLGFGYAAAEKAVIVMGHRYRMTMVLGVQPGRGGPLLNDADGGTPQRFIWLPAQDPDAPEFPPEEPERLKVGEWPSCAKDVDPDGEDSNARLKFGEVDPYLLTVRADKSAFHVVAIPPSVVATIRQEQRTKLRGEMSSKDALDSHAMLARLKIAAALMWLNGRTDKVSEQDWDLAGVVMAMSKATRRSVQSEQRAKAGVASRERGRQDAEREVAKAAHMDDLEDAAISRVAERIRKMLRQENDRSKADFKRNFGRDKKHFDQAVRSLMQVGDVELQPIPGKGDDAKSLHLKAGR